MSPCHAPKACLPPVAALLATLTAAACTSTPPPAPPVAVATIAPVEEPAPAPRPPPPVKPVDLHWVFSPAGDTCTAVAKASRVSLELQTTAAREVLVKASFPTPAHPSARTRPAKLTFAGSAGTWSIPGAWRGHVFSSARPLDERSLATLLGLLGGGTVVVKANAAQAGSMRVPPAGADGNAWVECPKHMLALL